MKIKLRSYQKDMVGFALEIMANNRGFAWWVAGCRVGKTIAALKLAEELEAKRTLVLTPKAAIRGAWQQDMDDYMEDAYYILLDDGVISNQHGEVQHYSYKSSRDKATFLIRHFEVDTPRPVIVVVNYETARLIAPTLEEIAFDLVIADESHRLKSHNSKQSLSLAKAFKNVPHKLAMTGTGWEDRPTDVYGQVRWLDPLIVRGRPVSVMLGSWTKFFEHYVNYYTHNNIKIPRSYKNQTELSGELSYFTYLLNTADVLELPEQHHRVVNLDMPMEMRKVYGELEAEMIVNIGEDTVITDNKLVQLLRLHQITGGYYPNNEGKLVPLVAAVQNPKLQALKAIIDEIGGEPLVIFTRFKQDVLLISGMLSVLNIKPLFLTGEINQQPEWQQGAGQVLIANISAGAEGINLNRARYCVYYSVGYSRTKYEQSLWRIRAQLDPANPVFYWHLCMLKTVDIDIRKALENKGKVADFIYKGLTNRL